MKKIREIQKGRLNNGELDEQWKNKKVKKTNGCVTVGNIIKDFLTNVLKGRLRNVRRTMEEE